MRCLCSIANRSLRRRAYVRFKLFLCSANVARCYRDAIHAKLCGTARSVRPAVHGLLQRYQPGKPDSAFITNTSANFASVSQVSHYGKLDISNGMVDDTASESVGRPEERCTPGRTYATNNEVNQPGTHNNYDQSTDRLSWPSVFRAHMLTGLSTILCSHPSSFYTAAIPVKQANSLFSLGLRSGQHIRRFAS